MGRPGPRQLILDAGALIAFERGDRRVWALVQRARDRGARMLVPAGVVAQVWRDGARQARVAALLSAGHTDIEDLTGRLARAVGELCRMRGTEDIVDASVALAARRVRGVVITSDPEDIRRLDPTLAIAPV